MKTSPWIPDGDRKHPAWPEFERTVQGHGMAGPEMGDAWFWFRSGWDLKPGRNLTTLQAKTLQTLRALGTASARQIADANGDKGKSIQKYYIQLNQLGKMGLARRLPHSVDGRWAWEPVSGVSTDPVPESMGAP